MTPEQINETLSQLESIPDTLRRQLDEISRDENLSAPGKDQSKRRVLADAGEQAARLESELTSALQKRSQQLEKEIADERSRFYNPEDSPTGNKDGNDQIHKTIARLDGHLRRSDLRQRWSVMSGREMLAHYQEILSHDDRALIEIYEAEAPRILNSRGDSETEAALQSAISKARKMRTSERLQSLSRAGEKAEIHKLRLNNALANIRDILKKL